MFKVGDKVITKATKWVGTVKRISPKRGEVTVEFIASDGHPYESRYRSNGCSFDTWGMNGIVLLSPEEEKRLIETKTIRKCFNLFEKKKSSLTCNQASAILQILQSEEEKKHEGTH